MLIPCARVTGQATGAAISVISAAIVAIWVLTPVVTSFMAMIGNTAITVLCVTVGSAFGLVVKLARTVW